MSLRFSYHVKQVSQPIVSLDGRPERPRPLVPIVLAGPAGVVPEDGLLDTGSDDTVFPVSFAARAGIDLSNAPAGHAVAVGGASVPVHYARAELRLSDGHELRIWTAWIAFTPLRLKKPLLGYAGLLQFFHAHFYGDLEEVELTPNSLYPGT